MACAKRTGLALNVNYAIGVDIACLMNSNQTTQGLIRADSVAPALVTELYSANVCIEHVG